MYASIRQYPSRATAARVSVVLPVRDGARFIRAAIDSVIAQTFTSLELVVVDDGSTDATVSIVEDYMRRDTRVRLLAQPRLGLVAALNAGLAEARGVYIARMDADDICTDTRFALQVDYLDRHPDCAAVGTAINMVDAEGRALGLFQFPSGHDGIVDALLDGRSAIAHPTVVMRRCSVNEAGGYAEGTFPCEDRDLWIRLSGPGRLANLPAALLTYRRSAHTVEVQAAHQRRAALERVIHPARAARGLPAWSQRPDAFVALSAPGRYHRSCGWTALAAGHRRVAAIHGLQGLLHDPWAWHHYVSLLGAATPRPVITFVRAHLKRRRVIGTGERIRSPA